MLRIENPKDSTQKLLDLINEFSKIEGYKINIQKLVNFFTLTMKYQEGNVKKTMLFKIIPKKQKTKPDQGGERLIY